MKRMIGEALAVAVLVVGVVALLVTGVGGRWATDALTSAGLLTANDQPATIAPDTFDVPPTDVPAPFAPPTGTPVAPAAQLSVTPQPKAVAARITAVSAKDVKGTIFGAVKAVGGPNLWSLRAESVTMPASVTKLVTSFAAVDQLGAQHRFTTSVVAGEQGSIVLVGGGDPLLGDGTGGRVYPGWTSLQQLAADTAAAVKKSGTTSVVLHYDDSLFTGLSWNPDWPSGYRQHVSPVTALTMNEGRASANGGPVPDPARFTAVRFAALLKERGITATGVTAKKAPAGARQVAAISSAPVGELVEHLLTDSDNFVAEVMMRHVGVAAGKTGSFTAGASATLEVLTKHKMNVAGTVLHDGSGLSRSNRISPQTLVAIIELGATGDAKYRPLVTGLPVGGVNGTLATRFVEEGTAPGRGEVRGKTGTLSQTHTLAGYVHADDGSVIAYAFLINSVPPAGEYPARVWLDKASAALAACGCR